MLTLLTKVYAKHNKLVKFPVQKVATNADKVMILLQLVLQGEPLADLKTDQSNPALDVSLVWQHAPRLAKGKLNQIRTEWVTADQHA